MQTRVVSGRARVVREVRAAGPLMARLAAPIPARGPWLTTVLNVQATHRGAGRPLAVVVESSSGARPDGLALLTVRRRWGGLVVTLLGDGVVPLPGRPAAPLYAADDEIGDRLATGVLGLVSAAHGPWRLQLRGVPPADPTLSALIRQAPEAELATTRTHRPTDRLDDLGEPVLRSRDPREIERRLPALLAAQPDRRGRIFLRAAARLHAAIGQVEVAAVPERGGVRAALLTLVGGAEREVWWGCGEPAALGRATGHPAVSLRLAGGRPAGGFSRRGALR